MMLRPGSHVAVVGGGPAGSFFALCALHYARWAGMDLDVTIFEPRDFQRPGPWGCNMCAGLIPLRSLHALDVVGLELPERIIQASIRHYTLHTAAGSIHLPQPDPEGDVCSVSRGNGPRDAQRQPESISFDGFMQDAARSRGAEVVAERVTSIAMRPRPTVTTHFRTLAADLVVLAVGVNRHSIHMTDLPYRAPPRKQMAQTELCPGREGVNAALGGSVHVFIPPDSSVTFGTLVPKGPCINVSLLGGDLPAGTLEGFLRLPDVARMLPRGQPRACGCRPHISVGQGSPLYADRFVAIGDAGITHLYKNGIGAALLTADRAAYSAVCRGVSAADFRAGYAPLCRQIALDNRAGRLLFGFTRVFQHHRRLALPHMRAVAAEQDMPPDKRLHSRLLWGMFTGTYPYRDLLRMAFHPVLQSRLLSHAFNASSEEPGASAPDVAGSDIEPPPSERRGIEPPAGGAQGIEPPAAGSQPDR